MQKIFMFIYILLVELPQEMYVYIVSISAIVASFKVNLQIPYETRKTEKLVFFMKKKISTNISILTRNLVLYTYIHTARLNLITIVNTARQLVTK